jgi:tetratricopeptide (TPR) repeat protein
MTQPIRLFGILLSSAALYVLCWGVAGGQQAPPSDNKPSEQPSGVRLIDTTADAGADNGAASAVRTASGAKSGEPAPQPSADATLHPVEQAKEPLQPPPPEPAAGGAGQSPGATGPATTGAGQATGDAAQGTADTAKTDKDQPAGGDKKKAKLQPIPDPQQLGPAELEATSFHGVTPGVTTVEEMEKAWGAPKEIHKKGATLMQLHSIEPFHRVEASCSGGKVISIIIRFDKEFPANTVAKQLELTKIQPVYIANELGEILGQAYPERGVLFSFASGDTPGKPSMKVSHIILEALSAEPFVLRAETNLDTRADLSLHDLDQALQLQAGNARAHWLRCRVLASFGEYEKAMVDGAEAIRLEPQEGHYRVTQAEVLARAGALKDAAAEAEKAVSLSADRPHVKARALCLLGDISASGGKPDYREAIRYHSQAVQLAEPLVVSKHPAVRVAAKEVMLDAHLGAAHDIAWGTWREKEKAVPVWLDKAETLAEDLIKSEAGGQEYRFRVANRALAICVGLRGKLDPAPWIAQAQETGKDLIAATGDPICKSHLQWDLGMAFYDAMQACQARENDQKALRYGQLAADYLEKGSPQPMPPQSAFLLGRLYFHLGAIHAVGDKNHRLAAAWFDKALPLLEKTPTEQIADPGRHGESLVSMGVSYWEIGQHKKALELTEEGLTLMEQAVKDGLLPHSTLNVPYGNLAWMHRQLGDTERAAHFEQMAAQNKLSELR